MTANINNLIKYYEVTVKNFFRLIFCIKSRNF